jgi:hypothetical protein
MRIGEIPQFCKLQDEAQSLMRVAMSHLNRSSRVYRRILKLARTIADLAGCEDIQSTHLAEALHAAQSSKVDDVLKTRPAVVARRGHTVRATSTHVGAGRQTHAELALMPLMEVLWYNCDIIRS